MPALNAKNLALLADRLEITKEDGVYTISGRGASTLEGQLQDAGITVERAGKGSFTVSLKALGSVSGTGPFISKLDAICANELGCC